jgi:hypothetical protein
MPECTFGCPKMRVRKGNEAVRERKKEGEIIYKKKNLRL